MIIDTLENMRTYEGIFPASVISDFLALNSLSSLPPGRTEVSDGVYVNVAANASRLPVSDTTRFENHRECADLHITQGVDQVRIAFDPDPELIKPYDKDDDVEFYESLLASTILLLRGYFVYIEPGELHDARPVRNDGKKAVFKIPVGQ